MKKNIFIFSLLLIANAAFSNNIDFAKESEKYKTEVLTLGQNSLFLLTPGKDPYVSIYKPDINQIAITQLGYNDGKKNAPISNKAERLENIVVLSEMTNDFSANIRVQKKYSGARESFIGENLANILFSGDIYKGKIIIDEYNKNIPMFWVLNNAEELRGLTKYIMNNISLETKNTDLFSLEKPLLVVKILNDPKFETLTQDDLNFLNTYFNIFSLNDIEVKTFFESAKETIISRGFDMANPRIKGESILESIFRQTEKQFGEWKTKDWAITAGAAIIATNTYNFLKPEVKAAGNYFKKTIGIDYIVKTFKGTEDTGVENFLVKIGAKKATEPKPATPKQFSITGEINDDNIFEGTITEILTN
ncbi:MAG: hypothetical protein ABIF12_02795 [bacterium]